ncbi:MAG: tRNA pseudouridine(38-40) synthase TruA, partial [Chloroflexi bacterium]|nr:tRNA pseudouridine(38-40) synthase TruA [Chloroflexota bacterium]
ETIAIQSLDVTADEFHARRSAKARTYRYTIDNRPVRAPLSDRYMWTVTAPLDDAVMHGALQTYVGVHDFEAFGRPPKTGESTEREVLSARCWRELDRVSVELSANAFLQGMVRRIVGALVAVGSGQITARDFEGLLRARDKRRVKWKAAPQGLCLWQVDYDDTAADSW